MSHSESAAAPIHRDVVLAVDDNEQNLQLLEEYLSDWGYEVVLARDGAEALQLYPRHDPSIIILDVMMPNVDGYDACRRIKSQPVGRTIPILMLTALTAAEDKIRALECGADDFLNKPINREELRIRIQSLIRIRNLRRELDSSESIILTLTVALENKDPRSLGHVQRVAVTAGKLAEKLGMTEEEKKTVTTAAMLHDIGMIGVPESALQSTTMTPDQEIALRTHTLIGASILEPLKTFRAFVPVVRWHHERNDGGGYPDGLRGDAIPLEAQVVAIANRFDEIVHELDSPAEESAALARLGTEAAGGAFDPELVALFGAAIAEDLPRPVLTRHMQQRPAERPHVLCIDSNVGNRELIATLLEGAGMDVSMANDAGEARIILASEPIDVVLLDVISAEADGRTALRTLRALPENAFLPIIVLASHRNAQLRQETIVAGADDFINYPLNRLELITRIQSLIRIGEYHADLEETQNIICALALTVEAKDPYTRGHSQRVGDLAHAFALHLGRGEEAAERARTAGLLHDIGKIAVPESLLNKQGPLTREEFLRVIDHPVIGEEMVRPLMTLSSVLEMIRHHHERFDGRGYPDALEGDAIPIEVRMLSIVDAYDALTSHRAYRPAPLTHAAALATLHREAAGGKWDPVLVQQFTTMLGDAPPDWGAIATATPELNLSTLSAPAAAAAR